MGSAPAWCFLCTDHKQAVLWASMELGLAIYLCPETLCGLGPGPPTSPLHSLVLASQRVSAGLLCSRLGAEKKHAGNLVKVKQEAEGDRALSLPVVTVWPAVRGVPRPHFSLCWPPSCMCPEPRLPTDPSPLPECSSAPPPCGWPCPSPLRAGGEQPLRLPSAVVWLSSEWACDAIRLCQLVGARQRPRK